MTAFSVLPELHLKAFQNTNHTLSHKPEQLKILCSGLFQHYTFMNTKHIIVVLGTEKAPKTSPYPKQDGDTTMIL